MKNLFKHAYKIFFLLLLLFIIGCGGSNTTQEVSNDLTSDITITLSFSDTLSKSKQYEKVTEISYVTLDVNQSESDYYIKAQPFIKSDGVWTIKVTALPSNTPLTFTAKAYSSSGELLYKGVYDTELLIGKENIIPIALTTATEVEQLVPSIRSIVFTNLAQTQLRLSIVNVKRDTLQYEIQGDDGGDFTPYSGELTFEQDTIATIELDYSKPEMAGVYSYRLILTNAQGDTFVSVFSITVTQEVEIGGIVLNLPPTINHLTMNSNASNLTLTADVTDDSNDALSYNWELLQKEEGVTINGSETVNPLQLSNYTQETPFKIRLTVADAHGASISTLYSFEGNYVVSSYDYQFFFTFWEEGKTNLMKLDTLGNVLFVKTLSSGEMGFNPKIINASSVQLDGVYYFILGDSQNGYALWRSDGTTEGTSMVKSVYHSNGHASMDYLLTLNGMLYFKLDDGESGDELWKSDGTEAGTTRVKAIYVEGDAQVSSLKRFNGKLYFSANDGEHGRELWQSDGTEAGTKMLKDINPAIEASSSPYNLIMINGVLYFSADDGEHGEELWSSDGTEAGTQMLKDLYNDGGSRPHHFTELNNKLYFVARAQDGGSNDALYESNGTAEGTIAITSKVHVYMSPSVINNRLYFLGIAESYGGEPWVSDGSDAGTLMLKDIHPSDYSYAMGFVGMNGLVYFTANDGEHGRQLWRTNGSSEGTVMAADIFPHGDYNYIPTRYLHVVDDKLYYILEDLEGNYSFWQSDGTEVGTQKRY